ncbi:Methyltranfer-dom domain-containing protein [Mycena indigotica]|uniref:Methyltranfer-dom domain-containing protein n=1 Tax=Mycena indigotica TaxID=2126181 RepID=A0A8H6SJ86_9AGAR|nr:Methyltranfer-dom domain-containing protein [Mycena indigotica]KAF7299322.1 Methyltranfer-dom domain-containing protein [Mycena indigotica]
MDMPPEDLRTALAPALALLQSPLVQTLLATHPNDLGSWTAAESDQKDVFGEEWWCEWVSGQDNEDNGGRGEDLWEGVLEYYMSQYRRRSADDYEEEVGSNSKNLKLPEQIRSLIDDLVQLALPRACTVDGSGVEVESTGLSPKKLHEVRQCIAYMSTLLPKLFTANETRRLRVVDVGSGQGYLTRALQTYLQSANVDVQLLALDFNEVQTAGAAKMMARDKRDGQIAQRTIYIKPDTLLAAVDDWIGEDEEQPVLFVALHACGSLTPDIFRAVFEQRRRQSSRWRPVGVLAVGCCYNLLAPGDFPLSTHLRSLAPTTLPGSAYHLAAQIPAEWARSPAAWADSKLALRKVVWRAILGGRLAHRENLQQDTPGAPSGTGDKPVMRRLGRLNNAVYDTWETFTAAASAKLGVPLESELAPGEKRRMAGLGALHVLRCLVGPLVESVIVADRVVWVAEQLEGEMEVGAVNLFNQATGSGRNVAIAVWPRQGDR